MTRKVVIAVDGDTPEAVSLLEWAARNLSLRTQAKTAPAEDAARATSPMPDAQVIILFVSRPQQLPDWGPYPLKADDKLWKDILAEDERRVEAATAALRERADRLHMPATVVTLPGDPRTVVADYALANGADLLVVGSRGLSGATQALLGSVSSYLVAHAACPVVVYRALAEGA
ncbi:hypothetical protein I4F81_008315 [Pyropia yezoensis]|uniref:Uncharacterized protein n=1 Tax=Pyropia yezoensis TaxID=2788 RepID=A0ACC3C6L4_PYRYE|nr:hypothetical protein I4F81_008315 [Neopyropia yezoensis]